MARSDMAWRWPTGLLRQLEILREKVTALEAGGTGGAGTQGPPGPTGPQGPQGEPGPEGPQGPAGNDGAQGSQGATGAQGPAGPKGDKGDPGDPGPPGADGAAGAAGATGATGPQGPKGDTGNTGPQGPQGVQGPAGADSQVPGPTGLQGPQGEMGPAGPTGNTGPQGPQGNAGPKGDTGDAGPQGVKGDTGSQGPQGPQGDQGPAGSDASVTNANVNTAIGTNAGATRTALGLGTAALAATGDFATAANGITAAERTKLAGIATGATANATDAQLRDRSTHTGTQTASTISDFAEAVDDRVAALIVPAGNLTENYDDANNILTYTATGSGVDPWTYVRLGTDFTTSSATAVDITGMAFTPAANKRYEFEGRLRLRTATATVGAKPGLAWPTGFVDGTAEVRGATSATAEVNAFGNPNAALLVVQTALPNTTQSWPAYVGGEIEMGASPSGTVKLQLASETAGTNVTCKAGSWLRYREVP